MAEKTGAGGRPQEFNKRNGRYEERDGYSAEVNERIRWAKDNGIELPLNSDGSVDNVALQKMYEEKGDKPKFGSQEELDNLLGEEFKGLKGQAAIDKLLQEKRGHVKGAFHREDIGDMDLLWGNKNVGLQHVIEQRLREKNGELHVKDVLENLNEAITQAKFDIHNKYGNFEFVYKKNGAEYRIIIAPEYHKNKITYLITAFRRGKIKT